MSRALYNEIDSYAAAWLRNLISRGLIADGDVAECSIEDLRPSDLIGYTQVHLFAGIGVWSYSMRRAGWRDNRPAWTLSCPCQPFSAAGKGGGFDDERHLWPAAFHLIEQCRPPVVLGEQVASKDGLAWLDLVQTDMEGADYAFGAIDTCSASVGAPHIRQRLRFVARELAQPHEGQRGSRWTGAEPARGALPEFARPSSDCGLPDAPDGGRRVERSALEPGQVRHADSGGDASCIEADSHGGNASTEGLQRGGQHGQRTQDGVPVRGEHQGFGHNGGPELERPGPTNGFWRDADWLFCRDGKWRPVEPGSFPLAHGAPSRVGRLRAYGNAVDAEATREFVEAVMGCL